MKASAETHADAGDKANDARPASTARELRCRVVGEGGNLGFTQRGRIEYALAGGRINTDAIDNVAGVNCSDHEVNIKILLDALVAAGDLTEKQRNELLREMTDAVGERVLYGSYTQTQAMSLALRAGGLDGRRPRAPDPPARAGRRRLTARSSSCPATTRSPSARPHHRGLVAPELAVVMAYCKIHLYAELLDSDLPEDPYLADDLERYFPAPLPERYGRRCATTACGARSSPPSSPTSSSTAPARPSRSACSEETGAPPAQPRARLRGRARGVRDARRSGTRSRRSTTGSTRSVQLSMLIDGRRLVERATRWLVRANPGSIDIALHDRATSTPGRGCWPTALPDVLDGADREAFDAPGGRADGGRRAGRRWPRRVAGMPSMLAVFDIVEVAEAIERDARRW